MAERDYPKLSVHSLSARKPAALAATGEDQFADFVRLGSRTSTTFAISPMSRDSLCREHVRRVMAAPEQMKHAGRQPCRPATGHSLR